MSNDDLKQQQDLDQQWKQQANGFATRASTPRGHLIERQKHSDRVVLLDLGVILQHVDDATNDIYLRETVGRISRLLQRSSIKDAISKTQGREYLQSMETILKRSVVGTERASGMEAIFRRFRINASVAILGHNISTALLAPVSYFQTVIPQYGLRTVLAGIGSY